MNWYVSHRPDKAVRQFLSSGVQAFIDHMHCVFCIPKLDGYNKLFGKLYKLVAWHEDRSAMH